MDPSPTGGDMSPLYVPRKRKSAQSQPKGVPCPVVQQMPERACDFNAVGYSKNDDTPTRDPLKMKRTYSRKRYEDLQSVSIATVEYPTTSCSVVLSSSLANGSELGSMAPSTARLPPRMVAKDSWPQNPESSREASQTQDQNWTSSRGRSSDAWEANREQEAQEQGWSSGRDRAGHSSQDVCIPGRARPRTGPDQGWVKGQDRCSEQAWAANRERTHNQTWNVGSDPGRDHIPSGSGQRWSSGRGQNQAWSNTSRDSEQRGHIWRPGSDASSVGSPQDNPEASTSPPSEEQKPLEFPLKKEPPTYPPGSQEECWQLQIVAKGRVTCPKCKSVSRKTVEGLKKHMENCRLQPFTCQHCGKQLKSSTGMKYHIMADHSHLPSPEDAKNLDDRAIKDKLRKILKRLGKLKCSREGCNAAFTSIMGYVYHMKKCGKEETELEKMLLNCSHCGKAYKSKAGLEYHLRSEHAPTPQKTEEDEELKAQREANPERTASGRVQRASAQVANFHLAEIANNDLPKDWPKRKFQSDLVPDDKKLKYARPGLPAFSQEVLRKWKNEVKLQRKVHCPNQGCGSTYTSVSGLKAHLGLCTRGDFEAGKYRCLICHKEFNSESGVKYHINSVHSQEWFVTNKKASKKFEKFLRNPPKQFLHNTDKQITNQCHHLQHYHHHHHHQQHELHQHPLQPLHHLQQQPQFLHPEHQNPQQQMDTQTQQPMIHYAPLEPAGETVWVEIDRRGLEQMEIEMTVSDKPREDSDDVVEVKRGEREEREGEEERGKADGRQEDSFAFSASGEAASGAGVGSGSGSGSGGSNSSSSNTGSSSSESEVEQQDRLRQMDQWNLKRPDNTESRPESGKRLRNT